MNDIRTSKTRIKPFSIGKGDKIGLIAPSGPINKEILTRGVAILNDYGLQVTYSDDIIDINNYLAGNDERRLNEFHKLWADPEIKAIIAARGGFGTSRLLNLLDYNLIAKNPKIIVGFSDLTFMLNSIFHKTGLISFHGPMLSTIVRDQERGAEIFNQLSKLRLDDIKARPLEILRGGMAEGVLLGGNLTCFQNLTGTEFLPDGNNAILFLEDVNEPAYKVDRTLTHLKMSGILDMFSGIILGQFLDSNLQKQGDLELIWQRILELTDTIPVWADFPVGHGNNNFLIPIGTIAQMDSNTGILHFQEASCQNRY